MITCMGDHDEKLDTHYISTTSNSQTNAMTNLGNLFLVPLGFWGMDLNMYIVTEHVQMPELNNSNEISLF